LFCYLKGPWTRGSPKSARATVIEHECGQAAQWGAGVVSSDRIAFNIKGNDYRLVVAADFEKAIVWSQWIGALADYDCKDVKAVTS